MNQIAAMEEMKMRETKALLDINRMVYLMPSMAGLMDQRTDIYYFFNNQTCTPGDTILANGNSSSYFLWGPACFLKLQWTVTNTAAAAVNSISFGYGSIMNMIKEIRITHSSGEVMEYIQNVNVLAAAKTRWGTCYDDQIKLNALLGGVDTTAAGSSYGGGIAFGFGPNQNPPLPAGQVSQVFVAAASSVQFTSLIPMSYIAGIFDRTDQYIPPSLLAGSTIQIVMTTSSDAYTSSAAGAGTATITEIRPSFIYDCARAFDSATRVILNEQSSEDGLQYVYSTYFNTYINSNTSSVNFDVQQAASVTENVFAVFRPAAAITGASLATFVPAPNQYQWRIGADFKPQAILNIPNIGGVPQSAEPLMQSLKTWESGLHQYSTEVGYGASVSLLEFNTFAALYGTSLERTACGLSLTGVPTNNACLLNFAAQKDAVAHRIDIFLRYLRCANLRGAGVVIDR